MNTLLNDLTLTRGSSSSESQAPLPKRIKVAEPVQIDFEELIDTEKDLSSKIEEGFGPNKLGLIIVNNVPNFSEYRAALLPLAFKLANLPSDKLRKLILPEVAYYIGWGHGKKTFQSTDGKYTKGSFFANPTMDNPQIEAWVDGEHKIIEARTPWPTEDLPELESAFKNLGKLMVDTGLLLSAHLDRYVEERLPGYEKGKITKSITNSNLNRGRLLHYYPSSLENTDGEWSGLHNDIGSLTALTSAMYFDKDGNPVNMTDPETGLFILNRNEEELKVNIPKGSIAFQIGECAQIHSGGLLMATPHKVVRGPDLAGTGISRSTFAMFLCPDNQEPMNIPEGVNTSNVLERHYGKFPELKDRWQKDQTYANFLYTSISTYYHSK